MNTKSLGIRPRAVATIFIATLATLGGRAVQSVLSGNLERPAHAATSSDGARPLVDGEIALGVSARVDASGARVPVSEGTRELSIGLRALGRPDEMRDVSGEARPERVGTEVHITRAPGVVEWWRSLPSGLEQGVTIDVRPPGRGALVLEMTTGDDARAERVSDDELVLADAETGAPLARYAHLVVLDARGQRVPARLCANDGRIRIDVDDAEARYPLVVDPILAVEEATLVAPVRVFDDDFGIDVAMSADGTRILVGAYVADPGGLVDAGTAYVFLRTGTSWALEATLVPPDAAADDSFGTSVALTPDASRALVGAYLDDSSVQNDVGSARVYVRTGTTWAQEATLAASDARFNDGFGFEVAVSADGTRALIGAPFDDTTSFPNDGGSVRIFVRSGSAWLEEATLSSSDDSANLGWAVALSAAGDVAVAGAPGAGVGTTAGAGLARVYRRTGTSWVEDVALPPGTVHLNRYLGTSVAITPDAARILVGAPYQNIGFENEAGAAYMYVRSGASWVVEAVLTNPVGLATDHFGASVALTSSGSRALIGADRAFFGGLDAGGAYLFLRRAATWTTDATLRPLAAADGDRFGTAAALAADGSRAVIGAYFDDVAATVDAGSATVFSFRAAGSACTDASDCGSGECVDGVCCDLHCGGGAADCEACTMAMTGRPNGTCAPVSLGTECRAVATLCDRAEVCDGTSAACPPNSPAPSGAPCRVSTGACDAQEVCDGASLACPGDALTAPGVVCRGAVGACDVPETCPGTSSACPLDVVMTVGAPCRLAAGTCDVAEACTGSSAACPVDAFMALGAACDAVVSGACDAPDTCSGMGAACPPTFLSGVECRASAGGCDAAEVCTGSTSNCPPDTSLPSGVVCRAPLDVTCDPAEACDGIASSCPADVTMCVGIDGGRIDGGPGDAGGIGLADVGVADTGAADAGPGAPPMSGCACRATGARPSRGAAAFLLAIGLLCATRVRRAARRTGP